jgi:hypothetical protein
MLMTLMKNASSFALVAALGLATFANAQTSDRFVENENSRSEKEQKNTTTDVATSAKVKIPVGFSAPRSGQITTGSAVKSSKAAALFGDKQKSDTSNLAQTQAPAEDAQAPAEDAQALAKKLANPISSLISVPFQNNFDYGMGADKHGFRYTMNFQPVIPFALAKDWNLISRTIVPVIAQHNVVGTSTQFGLGDTIQSFFFSPNKSEPFIWGVGPVLLIPTGTDEVLGTQKFGIGPTVVVLKQKKNWTVGFLFNHIWSVAGKESRADVSSTFLQPFISYTTKTAWTFTFNTESTYDWTAKSWGVPIHAQVTKLVKFGKQPVSLGGGLICWATSPAGGPRWCGFRLIFTPLFPVK